MKKTILLLTVFIFIISCGKEDTPPAPTPVDYSVMIPKIKTKLNSWQNLINSEKLDEALLLTTNTSKISFNAYPETSTIENNAKLTLQLSNSIENTASKVESGKMILTGDCKITIEEPEVDKKQHTLKFEAIFNCSEDKLIADNWYMSSFKITGN